MHPRPVRPLTALIGVLTASIAVTLAVAGCPARAAAAATTTVQYRAPSDAPIVDRFRPPPERWMAGNRGIDFGTEPGAPIVASADGKVVFAGPVAGALHVTVVHDDGLRTSYSFVASVGVAAGDRVRRGDVVATAGGPFHFGVRAPDGTYLDPELLLAGRLRPTVRLVPGTDDGLDALGASERQSLLEIVVGGGVAAAASVRDGASDAAALLALYAGELHPATHAWRVADSITTWMGTRSSCTDASVPVPAHDQRRIVVLVSGLGTSSGSNTAMEVDTDALGYSPADVVPFSYSGGRAPRRATIAATDDPFRSIPQTTFGPLDSQQSISDSADRLSELLTQVAAAQPGVPIDVVAHSQGGVVARLAVERSGDDGRLPPSVASLVTVSSPQQGAPLASAVVALQHAPGGTTALSLVRSSGAADELDDRRPAIGQLAQTSSVVAELQERQVPDRVRFVTIGGSGDLVVPGSASSDPRADATVLLPTSIGTAAHGSLPSSPAGTREIGLAIAGRGPTCQGLGTTLASAVTAEAVRGGEAAVAVAAVWGSGSLAAAD